MDIFSIDSLFDLIEKNKSKIKRELDMKILDNDKLSLESDKLLQVLDYNPKTHYSEKDIMSTIPPIKLNPSMPEKKVQKKNKHIKLVSTPNIDMDSFAINKNIERTTNFATKLESLEKSGNKESDNSEKKEEKKEENNDEDDDYEMKLEQRRRQIEEREKKKNNMRDDSFGVFHHKTAKVLQKKEG